ncbi:hypothetical protein V8G54_019449 [Vigna mungo]|uniref:Uncharacterized protein n=1 Tax=Vigna mungo TaxID=3915 RepID=A0AAQ3NCM9_VIGMU
MKQEKAQHVLAIMKIQFWIWFAWDGNLWVEKEIGGDLTEAEWTGGLVEGREKSGVRVIGYGESTREGEEGMRRTHLSCGGGIAPLEVVSVQIGVIIEEREERNGGKIERFRGKNGGKDECLGMENGGRTGWKEEWRQKRWDCVKKSKNSCEFLEGERGILIETPRGVRRGRKECSEEDMDDDRSELQPSWIQRVELPEGMQLF